MKKATIKSQIEAQLRKFSEIQGEVYQLETPLNREKAVEVISCSSNLVLELTKLEKETENLFKEATLAQKGRIKRLGDLREKEIQLRLSLWQKVEDLTNLQKSLAKRQLAKW